MKFTWLVRVHTWVKPIFLETIGPIESLIWGKMRTQNWFFGFHSADKGFLRKKSQSHILYSIPHRKVYIHFHCPTPHSSLKNGHAPKNYFLQLFGKIFFFFWNICYMKNIQNHISYKKVSICFCRPTPLLLKMVIISSH